LKKGKKEQWLVASADTTPPIGSEFLYTNGEWKLHKATIRLQRTQEMCDVDM